MKHWVFDLDSTLVNSFPTYLKMVRSIFTEWSATLRDDEVLECLGLPAVKFFASKLGEENVESALKMLRNLNDTNKIQKFSGISDILQKIRDRGCKIAIWTSRDRVSMKQVLADNQLETLVDYCVSGCCVQHHKPHPEGLLRVASQFGCHPMELFMVGDHEFDVAAASAAGAIPIRAGWHGFGPPKSCAVAHHTFHETELFSRWVDTVCER